MHLDMTLWNGAGSTHFLSWIKRNVVAGKPVIIGVFTNAYLFEGYSSPSTGYGEYDHIVPVHTITSRHPLSDTTVYPDDTLTFSDNGLYGDDTPEGSPYDFRYSFGVFPRTRAQANAPGGPIYSLPSNTPNYGVVITGVRDAFKETVPVAIKTGVNYEWPEMVDGTNARPAPRDVTLTITISGLKPGIDYKLYRYNSMAAIPNGSFNSNAAKASHVWPINISSGSTYTLTQTISSNQTVAYRAVPASAR
jgi:hypothetical protein